VSVSNRVKYTVEHFRMNSILNGYLEENLHCIGDFVMNKNKRELGAQNDKALNRERSYFFGLY